MVSHRRNWAIAAVLAGVTAIAFASALRCAFVNYDDPVYVNNPFTAGGLSVDTVRRAFTERYAANWHPLTWLSLVVDAALWRREHGAPDPFGFHLTNLLLHAANAALAFAALRALTREVWRSAGAALLFAVHPLRVESVAWVTERKDVLCVLFGLLALWAYAAYARRPSAASYTALVLAFAASLLSKQMLVTLPFLLLVLDWWPLDRWQLPGRCLWEKLPLFAVALAVCIATYASQTADGAVLGWSEYPLGVRLANAVTSYAIYLRQTVWPVGLAVYYPHASRSLSPEAVAGSATLLAAVTIFAVGLRRRAPYLLAGWFWFLGTLVPVIGLVQIGEHGHADRYTYFPQLGLAIACSWGVADLLRERPRLAATIVLTAALLLSVATWKQLKTWRDSIALWENDIAVTGGNRMAWYDLGSAREEQNDPGEAARCYHEALRFTDVVPLDPTPEQVLLSLGNALQKAGRLDDAVEQFEELCKLTPESGQAHAYLGRALLRQKKFQSAVRHLEESIRLAPEQADVCCSLGQTEAMLGRFDNARRWFTMANRMQPDFEGAFCGLALVMLQQGRFDEAATHLGQALKRNPRSAQGHYYLGKVLEARRDLAGAGLHYETAVRLDPNNAAARNDLKRVRGLQNAGGPHD
jgi:tetratricopeptide (TPR) repeat protein